MPRKKADPPPPVVDDDAEQYDVEPGQPNPYLGSWDGVQDAGVPRA